jgi:hypothetical protein
MATNKKEKPITNAHRELRERCVMPELFQRWTPEKTLEAIRNTISSDRSDFEWARRYVLADKFPRDRAIAEHRKGDWSFGFCYRIVEVASIIFESAGLDYESWFIDHAKKNIRPPFDSHWVLKSKTDDSYFDCVKGASVSSPARKKNGSKPIQKAFWPQHPSKGAMHLFRRIVEKTFLQESKQAATANKLLFDLDILQERVRVEWYKIRNLPVPPAKTP